MYGTIIGKEGSYKQQIGYLVFILGNTFSYYMIGLAGLFIGVGEILGKYTTLLKQIFQHCLLF